MGAGENLPKKKQDCTKSYGIEGKEEEEEEGFTLDCSLFVRSASIAILLMFQLRVNNTMVCNCSPWLCHCHIV